MRNKIILIVVCLGLFSNMSVMAQGVIVHKNDGTKIDIPYSELDSITTYKYLIDSETGISLSKEVDLGLSVKWAGWNVGASSPEEYGGYYAWGETEEKSDYTRDTYKYYYDTDGDGYKEYAYIGSNISGTQYDVARQKWGGSWRMPTKDELLELWSKCTWTWITYKGVSGYKVTGPNGNSIFLPAAGRRDGTSLDGQGGYGYYWSGTFSEYYRYDACNLDFYKETHRSLGNSGYGRLCGFTVRPVK